MSQQERKFIEDMESWLKAVVPGVKDEAAHSYAHELVIKLDITCLEMLQDTLDGDPGSGQFDFILPFQLKKIKSALKALSNEVMEIYIQLLMFS